MDLEFTATPRETIEQGLRCEIIEIGAIRLDPNGKVLGTFQQFVKPCYAKDVSMTVRRLTGIRRRDYLHESRLDKVLAAFAAWVGSKEARVVAWSENDKRQVEAECAFKDIAVPPCLKTWVDAQELYACLVMEQPRKKPSLPAAASWFGVECDCDETHRALYDAQVTAQVFRMLETGEYKKQQEAVRAHVRNPREQALSANIGSRCSELLQLRAQLGAKVESCK